MNEGGKMEQKQTSVDISSHSSQQHQPKKTRVASWLWQKPCGEIPLSKSRLVALWVICLVVGYSGVIGASYVVGEGYAVLSWPIMIMLGAFASAFFALIAEGVHRLLTHIVDQNVQHEETLCSPSSSPKKPRIWERLTPRFNVRSVALFSLIMALFWLPWLIANYPGGTYWDTYYQIYQCYPENHPIAIIPYEECYDNTLTDAYLCDHHPIFDTLIYGAFGMASDALTGNWMAGVFAFVCLQGIATVVALTVSIAFLRTRHAPPVLCFAAYVFCCIMPFISTWALCMVKDSLFAVFFIPYLVMLYEIVRTKGAVLGRVRWVVTFTLLAILLCLTKKQGLFVVVPVALIGAFVYRHAPRCKRPSGSPERAVCISDATRAFLIQALSCIVVMELVLPAVVFPLLNVEPGGKQEVLGTLFQQTARYVVAHPDEVSEEEAAAIDKVLEYENLPEQYRFDFQDEVKYRYKLDATRDDIAQYLAVWADQGSRDPEAYVAAVAAIAGYYVAPCGIVNIRMVTVDTHMGDDDRYMLWNPDELDWLRLGLKDIYEYLAHIPVFNLPLLLVTYVFWLPALLAYSLIKHRIRAGLVFVPLLVLLAFCIIAPVYDARYCIPLLDVAPLLWCIYGAFVYHHRVGVLRADRSDDMLTR